MTPNAKATARHVRPTAAATRHVVAVAVAVVAAVAAAVVAAVVVVVAVAGTLRLVEELCQSQASQLRQSQAAALR